MKMNIQKSRLAAIIGILLLLCMMVAMLAVPASAVTAPVAVYQNTCMREYPFAGIYELIGADLQGYDNYIALSRATTGSNFQYTIFTDSGFTCAYIPETMVNTIVDTYNSKWNTEISFDGSTLPYYTNAKGQKHYKVNFICPHTHGLRSAVEFTYHSASAFVDGIPDNTIQTVLNQIVDLLPVVVPLFVGFIALDKAIKFLIGVLHRA